MKEFSIFKCALEFSNGQADDIGQLASITRNEFDERETFLCRTTTASVEYACLLIENALLLHTNRAGRVYAGFEQFSHLRPIMARYLRIADVSEYVYLFGQDDWQPPSHPNIHLITLQPHFRLAREWFVIAQSPSLNIAVLAFDEVGLDAAEPEQVRYWALKTSNPSAVSRLVNAIEGVIDRTLAA